MASVLMIRRDEGSVPRQLNVILNWSGEAERPAPTGTSRFSPAPNSIS